MELTAPSILHTYNETMGGVDLGDQLNKYTKKYNHAIVTFYLEITNGQKSINQ
jgi:hypothetical protein